MQNEYRKGLLNGKKWAACVLDFVKRFIMFLLRVLANTLFTLTKGVGSTPHSIRLTLSNTGSKQCKPHIAGKSEHVGISGISS